MTLATCPFNVSILSLMALGVMAHAPADTTPGRTTWFRGSTVFRGQWRFGSTEIGEKPAPYFLKEHRRALLGIDNALLRYGPIAGLGCSRRRDHARCCGAELCDQGIIGHCTPADTDG